MFSLKTILFAATATLAGIASAVPVAQYWGNNAAAQADVDLDRRSFYSPLVARGTPSIPAIFADVLVKLDDILVDVRKSSLPDMGESPTDGCNFATRCCG